MNRNYITLNMAYFSQAFLFLAAGIFLLILKGVGLLSITFDSLSLIWLFGFVVSMVFGITNIMIPSYTKSTEFNLSLIRIEIFCLDSGIILLLTALNLKPALPPFFLISALLLLLSVLIHIYNNASAVRPGTGRKVDEEVYSSHAR